MLLEFVLALLAGILAGTFTGIAPAIHINLVSVGLIALSPFLLNFVQPIVLVVFIVAMSITHTFTDFIPSIFLGAPDEDTALSILPGHKLLLQGRGYEAVIFTLYGSIVAIFIIFLLSPLFMFFLPKIYQYIKIFIPFILIITSASLILSDKNKRVLALVVFALSGFLGLATLNIQMKEPLLPLLTGLFGSSSLITSIMKKTKLPKQRITKLKDIKIKLKKFFRVVLASFIASPLCSFLPALGSSQAAIIGAEISGRKLEESGFLLLIGAVNTIVMGLSFVTLYAIQKSRTGSAVAVSKLLENFSLAHLGIIMLAILITGIIAFFLAIFLAKIFCRTIMKINYNKLSFFILLFIAAIVTAFSGWLGFLVFIVSTATGLIAILLGARRTHLMGSLLVPSIILSLV
ncbi:tripartite tricarboxylate transporter permease [Candidatus Pacearchaeota archaeon]|nr:tripartite tricarboxylate transporter permease [Candidatus Pacearchaeota archaeon]